MKPRKETNIENAFTVDAIITMYHLKIKEYIKKDTKNDEGVCYDFWQILYLDSGNFSCEINHKVYTLCPGQIFFCEPGIVRHPVQQKNAVVGIISFRSDSPKMEYFKHTVFDLSDDERKDFSRILTDGVEQFKKIPEEEMFFGQQPKDGTEDYELQSIKNRLELLLIDLYKNKAKLQYSFPTPQNQINYYEKQFLNIEQFMVSQIKSNLSIKDISLYTSLSVSTIKRIFSRTAGCGAIHHFLTLKINEAKRLIRETDCSLTEISESLGFSSIHYFSRTFKKIAGKSPRQYASSVLKN